MSDNWCIKVADRVYGPYTLDQMRQFASEGRLAAQSLVAPAESQSWRHAIREEIFHELFFETRSPAPVKRTVGDQSDDETANFILIFDVVSGAAGRLENAIHKLGPAFRIADNVWTISTTSTAAGVRNAMMPHLQANEPLFVIDASRGRSAWHNYGPESVAKLHKTWVHRR